MKNQVVTPIAKARPQPNEMSMFTMLMPNQRAAPNRCPAGQAHRLVGLLCLVAFRARRRAAVGELNR
jgi:hypothetical protein